MTLTLKSIASLTTAAGLALLTSAASAQVTVTKYGPSTDTGSGITFTGAPLATFTEANGFFNTNQNTIELFNSKKNSDYSGSEAFGLDVTGSFTLSAKQTFTFKQGSDDGSYSFLTGPGFNHTSVIQIPGPTPFSTGTPKTLTLDPGIYSYEVQYSESNGAPGSLQFTTPESRIAAVPEPSSVASMALGGVGLLGLLLRARKAKRVTS